MNKKLLILFLCMVYLVALVSAEPSFIFKQGQPYNLQLPVYDDTNAPATNAISCTINVVSPTQVPAVTNGVMQFNTGGIYNYTIPALSELGEYACSMSCTDGTYNGFATFSVGVTGNGKSEPSGIVITTFIVIFIILLLLLTYLIIYSVGHAVTLDFDIIDAAWNLGGYFALVGLILLERAYLGNPDIDSFLNWAIGIGAVTNVILPIIYFILTLTVGSYMAKRVRGVDYS